MADRKIMKSISLNEPVSITLPVHTWHGFMSAYLSTKWNSEDASTIAREVIDKLFDPVFLKEREAAMDEHRDQHRSFMQTIITGEPPEVPPHMDEPGEI